MKLIRCVLLTAIVTWCAAGKLKQSLFSNLVSIDMQFLSAHRNELIAKYVGDEDCMVYEQITKDMHLRRNYVEVIIRGDLKNRGDKSVDSFVFLLPYHEAFQASTLRVRDQDRNELRYQVLQEPRRDASEIEVDPFNEDYDLEQFQVKAYRVTLKRRLHKGEKVSLHFGYALGQPYFPFPVDLSPGEEQKLMFYLSSKILLPYDVEEREELKIFLCKNCAIARIEDGDFLRSFVKVNEDTYVCERGGGGRRRAVGDHPQGEAAIRTDPNEFPAQERELGRFTLGQKALFYFRANNHLGYCERVTKEIKLSQLGFVYEREEYVLRNDAARINTFDRYVLSDYESRHTSEGKGKGKGTDDQSATIIYSMKSKINYDIYEYEYFDDLGKIYLIQAEEIFDHKKKNSHIMFDLRPRYPLLGGWRAHFFNSFYHDSNLYRIKNKENYYAYKIDIAPSIKAFFIKQLKVRISLPPFSENVAVVSRDDSVNVLTSKQKEWLDLFSFRNVVEIQIEKFFPPLDENYYQDLLVMYKFRFFNHFWKPLLVILIAFAAILLLCLLRELPFDFNTAKEKADKRESEEHATFLEKCKELYENLSYISDQLIQSMSKLTPEEKVSQKVELLEAEDKWTYDFIYYTKEFYRNFERSSSKQSLQSYVDKCFNYHAIVKKYFEAQLLNDLSFNLNEVAQAEKELLLLLKYT
ncbi:dolichyl-diphosphooligosaccharide--protein glycosyltransferase subunit OST1, putative [Plasmodium vivax]|uniref:Dolichyl-diphosphooligosaccharide--protein glycosyltransferase subunit 1 n=1 Tax=Plasmodium vivax (strain Brazil I) TaxID=1033975 RepID=A0A0J9VIU8_PLAV1|nr:ribophorin I [Plasmodium vivax Brazil I]CAI7720187.1 dolichyl-diphosphooligosaccharide--protein glycosyltransferase subunit OST1, putative [Plasmodium vivax]